MSSMDQLLTHIPKGDPHWVRDYETGFWNVCIFAPGTVQVLATVAIGMDKSVACWMVNKLKSAFNRMYN